MPDEQPPETPAQPANAGMKKLTSMLAIVIVVEAIIALVCMGMYMSLKRSQGDIAKIADLTERQLSDLPVAK